MRDRPQAKEVDQYMAAVDEDKRAALERLLKIVRSVAPRAEECISYRFPALRLDGKMLVAFGATAKHGAFYPMSGNTVEAHKGDLVEYETSKGTIRFQPHKPLPAGLVKKLVKARMKENAAVS